MAFDLMQELVSLCRAFQAEGIDYAICGGIAVAIHGYPRATQDLDILVQGDDLTQIETVTRKAGFTLSAGIIPFDSGKPTERRVLRVSKAEGEELLTLGLLLVTPFLEDVWAGKERRRVGDCEMGVVSRDGLVKMKKAAGRPSDLADLAGLAAAEEP